MLGPLDLRLLITFVNAAHSGSLSATAVQVGRTQSAVTMQMQRLEEMLGHSLLHRSGSGVRLTGSGERFLAYAERILKMHDEAVSAFSEKGLHGSIVFGSPEDYLLSFFPILLKSFGTRYPDVEIKVVSAPTAELRALLPSRKVDLALVSTPNLADVDNIVRTEPLVWVGSKPTLEAHDFGDTVPLALPASNAMDHRAACEAMARAGLRYKISYASNSLAGLIGLARSGLAICVMTQEAVPPDLHILNAPLPHLPHLGMLIAFADGDASPATIAFADHIRAVLPTL
ncbi:LysR family transcriptional regulator [Shinella yambaruensis]|uniref:LysR family transcriptional regulator n=1 Tax=Shinella yambaruensis TaxID=415996 RepID=A0ABQ5ZM76_9HYPH|nr:MULTISPECIES: LysR family transcriptional regulator [Shinella]CAI0336025.1 HTH-type transcriptional regulator DgdR [Rhizobiaceae bacterium]CAK7261417.1 HTH-type transcriptional regulator DgdR [Shinella sp. WSC3-e]ANH07733.1 LysR family transcriptional regulator [Shinella sp. HZN7]MCJ8027508.1 LysR family transcriptional regulator [Shinella yambaruensis]MCU7982800.1 LysR family transcriptional regulator [Shinella yambaruensis]